MKTTLLINILALFVCGVLWGKPLTKSMVSAKAAALEEQKSYLDLSKDPMVEGGFNAKEKGMLKALGWTEHAMTTDFVAVVQFKDKEGEVYYRAGWIPKGTLYMQDPEGQKFFSECSNFMTLCRAPCKKACPIT